MTTQMGGRTITTGLSGKVNSDILHSVIGQLSDGIWENSPGMEKYWKHADIEERDGQLCIAVSDDWRSGFRGKTGEQIKEF